MAADIATIAIGMMAAVQSGVASEAIAPEPLQTELPAALEQQIDPSSVEPSQPLGDAALQLDALAGAMALVPEFSAAEEGRAEPVTQAAAVDSAVKSSEAKLEAIHGEGLEAISLQAISLETISHQAISSGAQVEAIPAQPINASLEQPSIAWQVAIASPPLPASEHVEAPLLDPQTQLSPASSIPSLVPLVHPTVDLTTAHEGATLSQERQRLAQGAMETAEAQFLKASNLDDGSVYGSVYGSSGSGGSGISISESSDDIGQVTRVSQLRDVQPTDWAYQATQSLIERYGCVAGYPDGTFRGNRTLSRDEFAAGLNACLERITELLPLPGLEGNFAAQEDLAIAQQLTEQFEAELGQLRGRTDSLEQRQADLEAQQFSTTTRLYGQALFGLRGSNNNGVDLFPVDGNPERSGAGDVTLGGSAELTLATSFRGNDLLLTTLQGSNLTSSASTQFTNMGRLAYEGNTNNQLLLSDLSYRFAVTPSLGVIVGTHGVSPTNTFRGISPLEGSGDGALSRLGQRNPILELGGGRGGAGFDWQISPSVSLQGVYSATTPNQVGDRSGLFNGGYVAGGQVSAGLGRSADVGLHYLHSYSPNGSLGTGIGDAQVLSPFATASSSFRTHAVGATAAWRPTRNLTLGGWGGWTSSTPTRLSGTVQTTNWMGFAQVNDLFQRGNTLGLLVGQPPKITASNLPVGFNFPEFSNGGGRGGRQDTSLHLEAFYRAQLGEQISVTPGIVVVRNPNHNADNETLVVGAMRTTFRF